ncbi:hypothetical protein BJ742DRAFT_675467 [Cladochytrium replicatum]|nr:hypothetical protein BJ742DRAFT_675467 [Cladochytrium replicatum]
MDPRVFDSPLIDGNRVYRAEKYLPTPLTRVELDFLKLASAIRNMPGWNIKATHPEVLEKWKDEAKGQGFFQNIVERTIEEICMDAQTVNELERRNVELGRDVPIPVPHALDMVYGVFGSSSIPVVREQLRSKLIAEIKVLEDVPDKDKDWHPGSNYQVLDLIHPSLFPLVFGKTGGLTPSQVEAKLPWDQDKPIEWKKFQWLPSEIFVNEDYSSNVRSYISNLHPHAHSDLYRTIETIFGRFVPLFEAVLTDFLHWPYPLKPRIVLTSPDEFYDGGDKAFREWEHEHCENNAPDPLPVRTHLIPKSEVPRPRAHWISDPEDVMRFNLRDRSLQVIVKAANIHLTPEDPKYPGGVWHIEGMAHEAIVATGIYYYDIENISVSQLGFRMAVSAESVHYFQYDHNGMFQMYGLKDEGTSNQVWGHVEAIEGLCVAFSNVYQHRVYPFELADKTKPGHRKILVFFLVNPNLRVSSTADIPPQQMDWYWREVEAIRDGKKGRSMLERLPAEVLQLVRKILEAMPQSERKVFTTHEAIKIRKKLMAERKYERDEITQEVFERAVNLCEH